MYNTSKRKSNEYTKKELYYKKKEVLDRLKYELFGIEPKYDRNTLVLKRK